LRTSNNGVREKGFDRILERVVSFLFNEKIGCTGYAYIGNIKPFMQFISEYQGENFVEVWAELSRQLLEAVALIHEFQLVHGDITMNSK
jgi:hypothetical protein